MTAETNGTKEILTPLYNATGWIKFSGVISIIIGALSSLSIVGLLTGWMMIWPGIILCLASSKLKKSYEGDNADDLQEAMKKIALYFKLFGIFTILAAVLGVLAAILVPAFTKAVQMAN